MSTARGPSDTNMMHKQRLQLGRQCKDATLSVLVPVYNEADVLPLFHERLARTLDSLCVAETTIYYVDDGSSDNSLEVLSRLQQQDPRVAVIELSRNFGKEAAIVAGLDRAETDTVVLIDADLQDPPELIPVMLERWEEGYDVVYATRTKRHGESMLKRSSAFLFYRTLQSMADITVPKDSGDFRLLSRRAILALLQLQERTRYSKGLFSWIGFPQCSVPFERDPRQAGTTKWNYRRLLKLALEGITSFSVVPLQFASLIGLLLAFFAGVYGVIIMLRVLLFGDPVAGYPSMMVVILFMGGIQLLALGIIGSYLGKTFIEVKQRPLYFSSGFSSARQSRQDGAVEDVAPDRGQKKTDPTAATVRESKQHQ